jgi:hypothetical protein
MATTTLKKYHTMQEEAAAGLFSRSQATGGRIVVAEFTGDFVMFTALWLVLGALVGAKVVLSRRHRHARHKLGQALERQIYNFNASLRWPRKTRPSVNYWLNTLTQCIAGLGLRCDRRAQVETLH